MKGKLITFCVGLLLLVGVAHVSLNVGWDVLADDVREMFGGQRKVLTVGFLPVTCHLTCPVTNWATAHSTKGSLFQSQRYMDFPTMKEALIAGKLQAAFINMPLAMKMKSDGVPIKIVYLGHRDGTTFMVHKDSEIRSFADLKGKVVAIPGRFSNQNILMHKLMVENGMTDEDIELREIPPPDEPAALAAKAIDGYLIGEPHAAKAELGGWGRVLYYTKDIWPDFISCGLAVRQELIDEQPDLVEELVHGIAASGEWLDKAPEHRMDAAEVAARSEYFNQDKDLLKFVLSKPPDRVKYTNLRPLKKDFDEIMDLAIRFHLIDKHMEFEEYVDDRFAPDLDTVDFPFDRLPMEPVASN